jgi:hypothetical protein
VNSGVEQTGEFRPQPHRSVRKAILNHLDDLEDIWLAIRRLEKPGRIWTMKEVEQEVDLAN